MQSFKLWPSLLLTLPLAAQNTTVSPAQYATADGNTANAVPFLTAAPVYSRYMQVHSDLGTNVQVIKQIAFRLNGGTPVTTNASITIDMEMSMAPSVRFDKVSWVFANNLTGAPVTVIPRTVLNLGPISGTAASPEPFALKFPLTTSFPYVGSGSLLWEAKIYSNSVTASGTASLDMGSNSVGFALAPTNVGTGCLVTGQTAPMKLAYQQWTPVSYYTFSAWVDFAPANAPTVLAIGTSNPNTAVPGLCGLLYTNLLAIVPMGVTDANGFLGETLTNGASVTKSGGGAFAFLVPNYWGNTTLNLQAHALDGSSSSPIPVANSQGIIATSVGAQAGTPVQVSRLYSTDGGTTHANAIFSTTGGLTGLVTEFTY